MHQTEKHDPDRRFEPTWEKGDNGDGEVFLSYAMEVKVHWEFGLTREEGVCGRITVPMVEDLEGNDIVALQRFWQREINRMSIEIDPIALEILKEDSPDFVGMDVLYKRVERLQAGLDSRQQALKRRLLVGTVDAPSVMGSALEEAKRGGWMWAGSYFLTISKANAQTMELQGNLPSWIPPDLTSLPTSLKLYVGGLLERMNRVKTSLPSSKYASLKEDPKGVWGQIGSLFSRVMSRILDNMTSFAGDGHPVSNLQQIGFATIDAAGGALTVLMVGNVVSGGVGEAAKAAPIIGPIISGVAKQAEKITGWIIPIFVILFFFGILLAFYFPAIPFLTWIPAVVNWVILVLEAMVAVPFWIAMHAVTSQHEGLASEHTRTGYMLIFQILVYPLLSLFGLFCGIIIMYLGALILLISFQPFYEGLHAGTTVGPISVIVMFAMFVSLTLTLAHKSYTLCYEFPRSVLEWLGGRVSSLLTESSQEAETQRTLLAIYGRSQAIQGVRSMTTDGRRRSPPALGSGKGKKGFGEKDA